MAFAIVVGTGGEISNVPLAPTIAAKAQSEQARLTASSQFTLHATSYDWQFLPVSCQTFHDSGTQPAIIEQPLLTAASSRFA